MIYDSLCTSALSKEGKNERVLYLQGVLPVCGYSPKMGHFTVDKALVFGCLVVRTRCFLCWGSGLIPGRGTKILQAARCGQKNNNNNKKQQRKEEEEEKRRGEYYCCQGLCRAGVGERISVEKEERHLKGRIPTKA